VGGGGRPRWFSDLIDRALSDGPQTITRRGQKTVIVVSADEWERRTRGVGTLADFFAASPLRGSRLEVDRPTDRGSRGPA
jgi:prevent-host-death family protein